MVHKLGTQLDIDKLPLLDEKVKRAIEKTLKILDDVYGADRNINKDDGGYVIYAEPGTKAREVQFYFDYKEHFLEYAERIDSEPQYCYALYLVSNDFGVVIFTALEDTPEEVLNEICD